MANRYQWQGEPAKVRFGFISQKENSEKPLFWYNFECYNKRDFDDNYVPDRMCRGDGLKFALIPAIEVTQHNQTFYIANHYGIGVHKLLNGGWPNYAHFSLNGKFEESLEPYYKFTKFDLEEYEYHESSRRKWQKDNFPEEFERLEALRRGAQNLFKTIQ